jgi:hypothetical protein
MQDNPQVTRHNPELGIMAQRMRRHPLLDARSLGGFVK